MPKYTVTLTVEADVASDADLAEKIEPALRGLGLTVLDHAIEPQNGAPVAKSEYPECEKLSAIHPFSQRIGEFMDWLQHEHQLGLASYHTHSEEPDEDGEDGETSGCYAWAEYEPFQGKPYMKWVRSCGAHDDELVSARRSVESLMYEFFEIDPKVLEEERRAMLKTLHDNDWREQLNKRANPDLADKE